MDQAESSTPGIPLTYSGRNNKNKIHIITVFVDQISKKYFVEFQHSTNAKETLSSKINMEREAFQENIKISSFHADNGVFKAKQFQNHLQKPENSGCHCYYKNPTLVYY